MSTLTDKFAPLFQSRSVALVGASNDRSKWGFVMLKHLLEGGFRGAIYPVNANEGEILGLKVYKSISDIPAIPDLAVLSVPATAVLRVMDECIAKGIKAGVVITAGFAELGETGAGMQQEIAAAAARAGMSVIGPNCNGFMSPWNKQYVQFPAFTVPAGNIAVISQSGNVMDSLARQVMIHGQGCSICIAIGNEAVLHSEDYLEYLGDEPHTKVIMCYIEGFKDGRRFLKVASEVSKKKPIVMVKAGKTSAGARAAASHTASIAGSDAIFDAVCQQAGVIRAKSLDEMLDISMAFLRQPLPKGRRVGIITGGGGWGVLGADTCAELGFEVVKLPDATISELDKLLPPWWNRGNPVDLVAGSKPDNIIKAVEMMIQCPVVDCVMFLSIAPAMRIQAFDMPTEEDERARYGDVLLNAVAGTMDELNSLIEKYQKPLIVATEHIFATNIEEARIPFLLGQRNTTCYYMPHEAARVLQALAGYAEYRKRQQP
ncbi:MAG: CoA-binding protein [Dehalococcoidia bacterium]|nr:CoA-binding protein [Dehalococcoidia bacterium]